MPVPLLPPSEPGSRFQSVTVSLQPSVPLEAVSEIGPDAAEAEEPMQCTLHGENGERTSRRAKTFMAYGATEGKEGKTSAFVPKLQYLIEDINIYHTFFLI